MLSLIFVRRLHTENASEIIHERGSHEAKPPALKNPEAQCHYVG